MYKKVQLSGKYSYISKLVDKAGAYIFGIGIKKV